MDRLIGVRRRYDWGSPSALPALLGLTADGEPWAEHWFGAHPSGPALLPDGQPLDQVVAADPVAALGLAADGSVAGEPESTLPFLVKFLAAEAPLSLQAHPSTAQARAGFDAENARGLPIDAAERIFRDRRHKPELICALSDFEALCGFRDPAATREWLAHLAVAELEPIDRRLAADPSPEGIRSALALVLGLAPAAGEVMVDKLVEACERSTSPNWSAEQSMIQRLADRYPGDPGLLVALLLNVVRLAPGQALFLDAGNLHAYLSGVGLEVMANSDNVIRGGLTTKHVDHAALLSVVDPRPMAPVVQDPTVVDGAARFDVPVGDFALTRFELGSGRARADLSGPAIGVCTDGEVTVGSLPMTRGQAVWVAAADGSVPVSGTGTLYWTTVGLS